MKKKTDQIYKLSFILLVLPLSVLLTSLFGIESFAFCSRSLVRSGGGISVGAGYSSNRQNIMGEMRITSDRFTVEALDIKILFIGIETQVNTANQVLDFLKRSAEIINKSELSIKVEDLMEVVDVIFTSNSLSSDGSSKEATNVTDALAQLEAKLASSAARNNNLNKFDSLSNEIKVIIREIAREVSSSLISSTVEKASSIEYASYLLDKEINVIGIKRASQDHSFLERVNGLGNARENVRQLKHLFKITAETYNGNLAGGVPTYEKLLQIVKIMTGRFNLSLTSGEISNIVKDIEAVQQTL